MTKIPNVNQNRCPQCDHVFHQPTDRCSECGYSFPASVEAMNTLDVSQFDSGGNDTTDEIAPVDEQAPDESGRSSFNENASAKTSTTQATIHASMDQLKSNKTTGSDTESTVASTNSDSNDDLGMKTAMLSSATYESGKTMLSDHHTPSSGSADESTGRSKWAVWKDIADSNASPMMTIKTEEVTKDDREEIVIQKRILRQYDALKKQNVDYELIAKVGEGSMGQVFTARQSSVQRTVAVKTLKPKLASKAADREKFLYEAMITGDLDHPNIVPIHDLGVSDDGTLFYSMKHVTGTEWQEVLSQKSTSENVAILMKVADALAFAHSRRVIHRDLKPENIMLGQYGEVLVMDWGLAVNLARQNDFTRGGTPAFMAPEMAAHKVNKIDHRSDVYLLGAILYQLVVGYAPHPGRTVHECITAASKNIIIPVPTPDELTDIAYRAMATSPADRYQTVSEFQDAIREYQKHTESIAFADRGHADLKNAENEEGYESFSRAVFAFQDAIELWPENSGARVGLESARLAYAQRALQKEDYDLGLSLVDERMASHNELVVQLKKGAKDQQTRKKRLAFVKNLALLFGIVAIGAILIGLWMVRGEQQKLAEAKIEHKQTLEQEKEVHDQQMQREEEESAQRIADLQVQHRAEVAGDKKQIKDTQQVLETKESELFNNQLSLLVSELELESKEKELNDKQEALNDRDKTILKKNEELIEERDRATANAERAEKNAILAKANEFGAKLGNYKSQISLAKQYCDNNQIGPAFELLDKVRTNSLYPSNFKGWELHRLYRLCNEDETAKSLKGSIARVVPLSDNGVIVATSVGVLTRFDSNGNAIGSTEFPIQLARMIISADISPNQKTLALGLCDNGKPLDADCLLFDLSQPNPRQIEPAKFHNCGTLALRFVSDTKMISVGFSNEQQLVRYSQWQVNANNVVQLPDSDIECKNTPYKASGAAISESGKQVALFQRAISDKDETTDRCMIYDFKEISSKTEHAINSASFPEPQLVLTCGAFVPGEEENVVCGSQSGWIVLWNYKTGAFKPMKEHNDAITSIAVAAKPGEAYSLLSGSKDGLLISWDTKRVTPQNRFVGHTHAISHCAIFPSNGRFVSGDTGNLNLDDVIGTVRMWEPGANMDYVDWPSTSDVHAMAQVGSDQNLLFTGNQAGQLSVLDFENRKLRRVIPSPGHRRGNQTTLSAPSGTEQVFTCGEDNTTRIWNTRTAQLEKIINGTGPLGFCTASSDGTRLYTLADDRYDFVTIFDATTGKLIGELRGTGAEGNQSNVVAFVLSPDDRYLFTWHTGRGPMEIWDTTKSDAKPVFKVRENSLRYANDMERSGIVGVFFDQVKNEALVQYLPNGSQSRKLAFFSLNSPTSDLREAVELGDFQLQLAFKQSGKTRFLIENTKTNQLCLVDGDSPQNLSVATISKNEMFSFPDGTLQRAASIRDGNTLIFLTTSGIVYQYKLDADKPALSLLPCDTIFSFVCRTAAGLDARQQKASQLCATGESSFMIAGNGVCVGFDMAKLKPTMHVIPEPDCDEISRSRNGDWVISRHADNRLFVHRSDTSAGRPEAGDFGISVEQFFLDASCSTIDNNAAFAIDSTGKILRRLLLRDNNVMLEDMHIHMPGTVGQESPLADGETISTIECDPKGGDIACGTTQGRLFIVSSVNGEVKKTLKAEDITEKIQTVQFAPDGEWLVACFDKRAVTWSTANWNYGIFGQENQGADITSVSVSKITPNLPQRIALGRANGQVELWLIEKPPLEQAAIAGATTNCPSDVVFTMAASTKQVAVESILFTNDATELLTAAEQVTSWFGDGWEKPKPSEAVSDPVSTGSE
jgi:WD40 repeat protein